jgi:prepilin-type N-terminal cleavage/methylation domain-containing protein/prepilin-type processing-associated H-X9-DG protein
MNHFRPFVNIARRAFTLIELLAVIAIIGVLAAIIIASVGAVRQSAKEAKSKSNLRQIALACHVYANENKDRFPPGYYYNAGEGERIWTAELLPYIGLKSKVYDARQSLFVSPLAEIEVRDGSASAGVIPFTYSLHGLLSPDISAGDTRRPRAQVPRPARVILVGESTQRSNNTYANASFSNPAAFRTREAAFDLDAPIPTDTDVDGVGGALRYRARSGVPVAFVDGHVQALQKGTVTYGHIVADR